MYVQEKGRLRVHQYLTLCPLPLIINLHVESCCVTFPCMGNMLAWVFRPKI